MTAPYKLTNENFAIRVEQTVGGVTIPEARFPTVDTLLMPNDNADYLAFKAWLAEGGVPDPADNETLLVPHEVTMRQAQRALLNAGLLDVVKAALEAMPGTEGEAARIDWATSSTMQRDQPFVAAIGAGLGLTSEQIDQLFITAAGL